MTCPCRFSFSVEQLHWKRRALLRQGTSPVLSSTTRTPWMLPGIRQVPYSWILNSHWRDQQLTRSDVFIKFQLHSWNSAAHASWCYDVNWMEYFVIWSFTFSVSADICAILALTTTSFDVDKTIHAPNLIFPSKNDTLVLKKSKGNLSPPLKYDATCLHISLMTRLTTM